MIVEKSKKNCFRRLRKVDLESTMGGGLNHLFSKKIEYEHIKNGKKLIILLCVFLL